MSLQCSDIYLFDPIFVDNTKDSVDVGLGYEAFDHSQLLVCQDLLVDRFPDLLKFVIAFIGEIDAFKVEINQFSECVSQLLLFKGGQLLRGLSLNGNRLYFNCPLFFFDFLQFHLQILVLGLIIIDHPLQFVLQLVFVFLMIEGNQSKSIFFLS